MKAEISHNLIWFPVFIIGCINISMSLLIFFLDQVPSTLLFFIASTIGLTIITIVVITKLGTPKNRLLTLTCILISETAFFIFFKSQILAPFFEGLFLLGFLLFLLSLFSSIRFRSN